MSDLDKYLEYLELKADVRSEYRHVRRLRKTLSDAREFILNDDLRETEALLTEREDHAFDKHWMPEADAPSYGELVTRWERLTV